MAGDAVGIINGIAKNNLGYVSLLGGLEPCRREGETSRGNAATAAQRTCRVAGTRARRTEGPFSPGGNPNKRSIAK